MARLSDLKKQKFLTSLAETCNVTISAKLIGFSRQWMYEARKIDPAFAAEWEDAIEQGTDALESEARRRALHGTDEPVFYRGEVCGSVKRYSDMLLIKLLTAYRPEKFKERSAVETTGKGGGPIEHEHSVGIHPEVRALIDNLKADIYRRKEAQAKGDDGTQDLSPVTPESIE